MRLALPHDETIVLGYSLTQANIPCSNDANLSWRDAWSYKAPGVIGCPLGIQYGDVYMMRNLVSAFGVSLPFSH